MIDGKTRDVDNEFWQMLINQR